jgi:hypothetical protein
MGEYQCISVVSPHDHEGTELELEPDAHPAPGPFTQALKADGSPSPRLPSMTTAVLDDTSGDLIQPATNADTA